MGYSKISAGTLVAFITWALTTYVPAWHSGLPSAVSAFLPAVAGLIAVFLKKEKTVVLDAEALVQRGEVAASRVETVVQRVEQAINGLITSKQ